VAAAISPALDLLDIDAVIANHCGKTGRSEPSSLDERKELHLVLLYETLGKHGKRKEA
jgi:hypothetical protein